MKNYRIKLFVAGESRGAKAAESNIQEIMEKHLSNCYELTVIDILKYPELAEENKIMATPTLIKEEPPPLKRIIGDLSNKTKIINELDLSN